MTYTAIIAEVVSVIDRSDFPTTRARGVVLRCRAKIQRKHAWQCAKLAGPGQSAPIHFVNGRADVPVNAKQLTALRLTGTWNGTVSTRELYPTSKEMLTDLRRRNIAATATVFALEGGQIIVPGTLPTDVTAELDFLGTLDMPATDEDWWSANGDDVIIDGSVALGLKDLGQEQRAATYRDDFERGLLDLIKLDRERGATATVYTPPPRGRGR